MKIDFFYDSSKPRKKETSYGKLAVQQRMRLAMAFLNPLRHIVSESWLSYGKGNKRKAFGQAIKKLMQDALEGNYPDQRIVPSRVDISMGILPTVIVEEVVHSGQELQVVFSSVESPVARATDEVVLVAYGPEAGIAGRNTSVCPRSDGHINVELPPQLWSTSFHVYLFVNSANRKQYSKSTYVGQFGLETHQKKSPVL